MVPSRFQVFEVVLGGLCMIVLHACVARPPPAHVMARQQSDSYRSNVGTTGHEVPQDLPVE